MIVREVIENELGGMDNVLLTEPLMYHEFTHVPCITSSPTSCRQRTRSSRTPAASRRRRPAWVNQALAATGRPYEVAGFVDDEPSGQNRRLVEKLGQPPLHIQSLPIQVAPSDPTTPWGQAQSSPSARGSVPISQSGRLRA